MISLLTQIKNIDLEISILESNKSKSSNHFYKKMGICLSWLTGLTVGWQVAVCAESIIIIVGGCYGSYKLYKYCTRTENIFESEEIKIAED